MNINTQKIASIIRQSMKEVGSIHTPWLDERTTIGEVNGLQIQIVVTSEEDDFTNVSLRDTCVHDKMIKPELGMNCVVWYNGEPKIDYLTEKDHHKAYWAESLYAYGDEDKFLILYPAED
jgi:hypothetical protein